MTTQKFTFSLEDMDTIRQKISRDTTYRTNSRTNPITGYPGADPQDIGHLMNHYADQIMFSRNTLEPVELAAMAHRRLMEIMPYSHDNFPTAIELLNHILIEYGFSPVSFPDNLSAYREAFILSEQTKDIEPFAKYIKSLL